MCELKCKCHNDERTLNEMPWMIKGVISYRCTW